MSQARYKDLILETIDALRKRKARPDMERICHILERKHNLKSDVVQEDLMKLITERVVIKVDYKGSVSYRNAAKWRKRGSYHSGENSPRIPEDKAQIFEEDDDLCFDNDEQTGAFCEDNLHEDTDNAIPTTNNTVSEIETSSNETVQTDIKHEYNDIEVQIPEKKIKLEPQNEPSQIKPRQKMKPGPKPKPKNHFPGGFNDSKKYIVHREKTPSPGKRGRGSKRKRIQKTHGPDFESYVLPHKLTHARSNSSEERRVRTTSVTSRDESSSDGLLARARCDFCLLTSQRNPQGHPEDLLFCKDCQAKAHPSCMEYSTDLARRARTSPWQCIDCKTCCLCNDSGDADAMLFCDSCDKGYHMECHNPPITDKPTGSWVCSVCERESPAMSHDEPCTSHDHASSHDRASSHDLGDADTDRTIVNGDINGDCVSPPPSLPTPRESPVPFTDRLFHPPPALSTNQRAPGSAWVLTLPSFRRFADAPVPDASVWSVDQVVDFFFEAGFKDECDTFREQEIDGRSLLLMRRSDVLQGLDIKLGPALKIYAHVQRLQTSGSLVI